jgi:NAD(P)H-dependent FMN reductase
MKIVGIGGSLRSQSYTYQVLKLSLQCLSQSEVETSLVDLRLLHLPFCDGSERYANYPDVVLFKQQIQEADGIVLATPEYHGSVSGVLKNALDLLDEEQMRGKVVALIAVVGGVHSTNAINTLRIICRQLHSWVLPEQIIIPNALENFDAEGQLLDPALKNRLNDMMQHLVQTSRRLAKE